MGNRATDIRAVIESVMSPLHWRECLELTALESPRDTVLTQTSSTYIDIHY